MRKFQAHCEQYLGESDPIEINGLIELCQNVERETIERVVKTINAQWWDETEKKSMVELVRTALQSPKVTK